MGLMVHSLENIPISAERDYFIYLLDYGWDEPISEALRNNFDKMAHESAVSKAVIIKGTVGEHFQNEVFSWHKINGMSGENMLPALLISNMHPSYFRDHVQDEKWGKTLINENSNMKLILIPFKKFCKNSTEAVELIQRIFRDIKDKKDISDFSIALEMNAGRGKAIVDALILEPNFAGIGIDLKRLISGFLK